MTYAARTADQVMTAVWENSPPPWVVLVVALLVAASWLAPFRNERLPAWVSLLFTGGFLGCAITSNTGPAWLFAVLAMVTATTVAHALRLRAKLRGQAEAPPPE